MSTKAGYCLIWAFSACDDGFGVTRKWSQDEQEGKPVLKWYDPYTWWKVGYNHFTGAGSSGGGSFNRLDAGVASDGPEPEWLTEAQMTLDS